MGKKIWVYLFVTKILPIFALLMMMLTKIYNAHENKITFIITICRLRR